MIGSASEYHRSAWLEAHRTPLQAWGIVPARADSELWLSPCVDQPGHLCAAASIVPNGEPALARHKRLDDISDLFARDTIGMIMLRRCQVTTPHRWPQGGPKKLVGLESSAGHFLHPSPSHARAARAAHSSQASPMSKLDEMIKRAGNRENGHCPKCKKETQQLVIHDRIGGVFSTIHKFYIKCQSCGNSVKVYEVKV